MKITVEIDCTPAEARQFFGQPDLQPMQERLLIELEAKMRVAMVRLSPESIMQQWFAGLPDMQQAWANMLRSRGPDIKSS